MRAWMSALVASACIVGACGGGEKPGAGSGDTATKPPAETSAAPSTGGTAQAVTGKTWDVKMLGDATGYRFEPASLTIKRGDGIRWTVVSGPPHDVAFWVDSIPAASSGVLQANMPQTIAPLTGPLLNAPNETYVVSFAGVPAGTYHYYCTPHLALGMKGTIVVE